MDNVTTILLSGLLAIISAPISTYLTWKTLEFVKSKKTISVFCDEIMSTYEDDVRKRIKEWINSKKKGNDEYKRDDDTNELIDTPTVEMIVDKELYIKINKIQAFWNENDNDYIYIWMPAVGKRISIGYVEINGIEDKELLNYVKNKRTIKTK